MPTGRLRARLTSMTDQSGIAVIAVDPAYTSRWGAQHWQKPLTHHHRKTTVTMRRASRSDDAPKGIRSGWGHLPGP
jgi:putative N-acetylmannosamine-6-phosphate epimerase